MVVGSALPRVLFDVTDNAETQLRIFVEDLSNGHVVTQIRGDKRLVTADLAEKRSYPFASFQSGIGGKDAMTFGCKLVERARHSRFPYVSDRDTVRPHTDRP